MHFVSAFSFLLSSSPVRLKVAVPVRNAHSTLAVSGLAQNPAVIIRSVQACVCVFTWSSSITLMHTSVHTHSHTHTHTHTHTMHIHTSLCLIHLETDTYTHTYTPPSH